jgi:hypothetical protein
MGADLITYTLLWQGDITERFDAVRKHAAVLREQGRALRGALLVDNNDERLEDLDAETSKIPKPLLDVLRPLDYEFSDIDHAVNFVLTCTEPKQLEESLSALCCVYRDEVIRKVEIEGKSYAVLVAGGMSWGDEPDGAGYQGLKMLDCIGAFPILEVL